MRWLSTILVLSTLGLPFAQPVFADDAATKAEIEAAIQALNDAFAGHDEAAITNMVTADHLGVSTYGGAQTTQEQFATLGQLEARYFDFSPTNVTALGPDTVQVTYENSYEGTFAGKPLPSRVFVSQIWLRRDGQWRQQLYQETPLPTE